MVLDGKLVAESVYNNLKERIKILQKKNTIPHLAVILVGHDAASKVYVRSKEKMCAELGIKSTLYNLPTETNQEEIDILIEKLNADADVHGILCQLPLPAHLDSDKVALTIAPYKDVDGLNPLNQGLLMQGKKTFIPCTVKGILRLLQFYAIATEGKKALVIGRSAIVGRPLSILLSGKDYNATVTLCHSKSIDLQQEVASADLIFAALGQSHAIDARWVKEGGVIIDVGINRVPDEKNPRGYCLTGDVLPPEEHHSVRYTPVPGGVGPLTIAMLMENSIEAAENLLLC